jgi:hypothetical protein
LRRMIVLTLQQSRYSQIHMMKIAGFVFLSLGALLLTGNWLGVLNARRNGVGFSCIPFIGGLFGCAGLLSLAKLRLLAFVPLLVDPSCVPMLFVLLVKLVRRGPHGAN